MEKPASMAMEEFRGNIIQTIDNSGLPLFVIEMALRELTQQVAVAAAQQNAAARQAYESQKETKEA